MFARFLLIFASFSLLAACGSSTNSSGGSTADTAGGGGDGGGGGGGGGEIAIADLPAAAVDAFCQKLITCPGAFGGLTISSVDTCKALLAGQMDMGKMQAGVADGSIKYDASKAGDCLAAMTATCNMFDNQEQPAACKAAVAGQVETGKPCTGSDQCKAGYCFQTGQDCPGVCADYIAAGGDCSKGGMCATGAHCIAGKCSSSGWGGKDGACNSSNDCDASAYCSQSNTGGACTTRIAADAACQQSDSCVAGTFCKQDQGGGKCAAVGKAGDACQGSKQCAEGLGCVEAADGKSASCAALVAPGGACTSTGQCAALDTWCTGAEGAKTCQPLPAKGEACATGNNQSHPFACMPPSVCNGTTCGDKLPKDAACQGLGDLFNPCATGLVCAAGKCAPLPGEGQPCDGACADGLTCSFDGTSAKCAKVVCK